jgi:serine protease 16
LNLFQTLLPFYQLVPLHCGPSQPTGDLSLSSLRHLSSSQALADAARFVTHVTREYSLPPNTKWVSFGGSYPGMMAGWLRLKYPHLVHASVASSAPVQASLEMRGYNDVIAASLAEADVGGSAACVRNVRGAFLELSAKLSSSDGRREVEKNFNVCDNDKRGDDNDRYKVSGFPLDDPLNRMELLMSLSEVFPAQSNDPSCTLPGCDIRAVCAVMTDETPSSTPAATTTPSTTTKPVPAPPPPPLLERLASLASIAFGGKGGTLHSVTLQSKHIL